MPAARTGTRRRPLRLALAALLAIVVALGVRFGIGELSGDDVPAVGDCMNAAADANDMGVVDCGSEDAAFRVVGNDGAWVWQDFEAAANAGGEGICEEHPQHSTALFVGEGDEPDSEGEVVCLEPTG